jgi:molybdopterin molybdotransferase
MIEKTYITVEEAINTVLDHTEQLPVERIPAADSLGRVLAEGITAHRDHPPWDNSAMDGYAVRWQDIKAATAEAPTSLTVIGEVQAGDISKQNVGHGEALQIMTGAPIPAGANGVVPVENTQAQGEQVHILKPCKNGDNIRPKGEDMQLGQQVLTSGSTIRPAEIGMLATAAKPTAAVYQQPQVSVLSTGNELAELGETLTAEKIVNSNSYSIAALVSESGGIPTVLPTAQDSRDDLEAKIQRACRADIALVIGGVSMGKYDFVKDVLADLGVAMKFWRVKMRPGHPIAFGVIPRSDNPNEGEKLLFALPGNPVSCMVAFYQFVLPAMRQMMGMQQLFLPQVEAVLDEHVSHRPGRRHFARAVTHYKDGRYVTRLTGDQGSGIITSMVQANSLMILSEEGVALTPGDSVTVQMLPQYS